MTETHTQPPRKPDTVRTPAPPTQPHLRVLGWLAIIGGALGLIYGAVSLLGHIPTGVLACVSGVAAIAVGVGLLAVADIAANTFANNRLLAHLAATIQPPDSADGDRTDDRAPHGD